MWARVDVLLYPRFGCIDFGKLYLSKERGRKKETSNKKSKKFNVEEEKNQNVLSNAMLEMY